MAYTPSYWERETFLQYDVIIIGSGIVGLSTACSILEKNPNNRVLVLERGILPSGASTRNAGFACFGSLTEILADLKTTSGEEVLALVKNRYEGLQLLRKRTGDVAIGYQELGGYELLPGENEITDSDIKNVNEFLFPVFGKNIFSRKNERIEEFGFKGVDSLLFNLLEGQLHSGKMMQSLLKLASGLGANIITGCHVEELTETEAQISVKAKNTFSNDFIDFKTGQVIVCTNAFGKQFFPGMDINPGRGQVIITKPVPDLKIRGTFHAEEGYYYFRNIDNRVLLGGGRNLDIQGETTTEFGENENILDALKNFMSDIILPDKDWKIDMQWSGIMAFGATKTPIVERISPRIIAGVRMGGMGVALGSKVGEMLAKIALELSF